MRLDEPARLATLDGYVLLEDSVRSSLDAAVRLASRALGVPVSLLSLVDDRRQRFAAHIGLPEPWASTRETPLSHSFCQQVVIREQAFRVDDSHVDPRVKGNRAIDELDVRAYLGVPLVAQGQVLGALCAIDSKARAWGDDDQSTLEDIARSLMLAFDLQRQRGRVDQAVAASEHATWVIDVRDGVSIVTMAGAFPFQLQADARGSVGDAWLELIHPDDREPMIAKIRALLDGGAERFDTEYRIVVGEDVRWVRSRGRLTERWSTDTFRIAGVVADVTREREERQRALRDARIAGLDSRTSDIEYIAATDGRIVEINDRGCEAYGRTREELCAMTLRDLRAPATLVTYPTIFREMVERGEVRFETEHRRRDGTSFPVFVSGRTFTVFGERFFHSIVRDLTEQRANEAKLILAQRLDGIGVLAGGIAHDFNNVLMLVQVCVEAAQSYAAPGSELAVELDGARVGLERGRELVNLLVRQTRHGSAVPREVDMERLLDETCALLSKSVPKAVRVREAIEPGCAMRGDPTQLRQVLTNLVLNAVQAIGERVGMVTVSARPVAGGGLGSPCAWSGMIDPSREYVEVTVADDGPGMSADVAARVFDPFFTTKREGRGLGLSAVVGILHAHEGAAQVTSTVGQGTRVSFVVPKASRGRAEP